MPITATVNGTSIILGGSSDTYNSLLEPTQDFVIIGGQKSPGLAIVKNIGK